MAKITKAEADGLPPGKKLGDGDGLWLTADRSGTRRRWVVRFVSPVTGRRRDAGIGSYPDVGMAKARERAKAIRAAVRAGHDPLADAARTADVQREEAKQAAAAKVRSHFTLETAARAYHRTVAPTFKNAKHAAQWLSSLERHVFPVLGKRPLDSITADDLLNLLLPLREELPETAKRVRLRLDAIFDDAMLRDRVTSNPARAVARKLKKPKTSQPERHFRSLPFVEVPEFMRRLREDLVAALPVKLAFQFLVLTAARTGEVLGARWDEITTEGNDPGWLIPADRMKRGAEHWVPLSKPALAVLNRAREVQLGPFVFSLYADKKMSDMVLLATLRRLRTGRVIDGAAEFYSQRTTAHGFRSSFSTWARERTNLKDSVVEAALSHSEAAIVQSYSRTDYRPHRRELADLWASFVMGHGAGAVIEFPRSKSA